ncbi:N-acetyl-gamma-glutamyl-phosphate reductase [Magnetovibrio sp. PR-2]|uniref:N-acetyl-gamma-glutamyl-phosphate reductase n=1 Tax=Magnetovibrio sp. PR-2 TaxID=3120356 RepID=UPI002FCE0325
MSAQIFIDGEAGTTGLQIRNRLKDRTDIEIVSLTEETRKDASARRDMLNSVDLAILCLPDDAAREAVSMIENDHVKVIDASTAYRVDEDWAYGFAELNGDQTSVIANAKRVSNPGCYAVSSISMLNPLVSSGLLPADHAVTINAISGYSGGGKQLIANFEDTSSDGYTESAFFAYGLTLKHKHVPEIQKHGGLSNPPLFVPSVGRFAQGMLVQLPLQLWDLPTKPSAKDVHGVLADHYAGRPFVKVADLGDTAAMARIDPQDANATNDLRLFVFANEDDGQAVVMAQLDNLGKGASGSCVQNLNIMFGFDEGAGL